MASPPYHAESGLDTSSILAEKDALVAAILGFHPGCDNAATIKAVAEFLLRFRTGGIPWVQLYHSFPFWQQCGLLNEQWDRHGVSEGPKVFFTLLSTQGPGFSREAVGGGQWTSKGATKIGPQLEVSKLYFKSAGDVDRFTILEFRLTMDLQPRVAVCLLHPTGYHGCIRELRRYIRQGWFPWGNQGNPQMAQPLAPIYPDPCVPGFMNGLHGEYNNVAPSSEANTPGANQTYQMLVQHEGQYSAHNISGFLNGLQPDYTTHPVNNESSRYYPPAGIQMDIPSNTYPMNDDMCYMPSEINMFGGQYSHANGMSIQSDYCNTSFWDSTMHAPIHDATTSYSQPSIHFSTSLDGPFDQLMFSENNSMPEPTAGEYSHADGASTQHYYCYNPY